MKKRGAKKKAVKPSHKKISALSDAKLEFCFRAIDGNKIKNIMGLSGALEQMSDETFYHHASQERNDFANWIRDIFKQKNLASDIAKAQNKVAAQVVVLKFLIRKLKN